MNYNSRNEGPDLVVSAAAADLVVKAHRKVVAPVDAEAAKVGSRLIHILAPRVQSAAYTVPPLGW